MITRFYFFSYGFSVLAIAGENAEGKTLEDRLVQGGIRDQRTLIGAFCLIN